MPVLISCFSVAAVIKHHDQSNLRKSWFQRDESIVMGQRLQDAGTVARGESHIFCHKRKAGGRLESRGRLQTLRAHLSGHMSSCKAISSLQTVSPPGAKCSNAGASGGIAYSNHHSGMICWSKDRLHFRIHTAFMFVISEHTSCFSTFEGLPIASPPDTYGWHQASPSVWLPPQQP